MARPEKPIDPAEGPVAAFAVRLRRLREDAGSPSYRALARRAHYGHTTLSEAAAGRRFPNWPVTRAFVLVCNGDLDAWEKRWRETADLLSRSGNGGGGGDENGERSPPRPASTRHTRSSGGRPVPVDPGRARTPPELMSMLNELRGRAGLSLLRLVERSWEEADRGTGVALQGAAVSEILRGRGSPRARDVLRIVELCGGTTADLARWAGACDRLLDASDDRPATLLRSRDGATYSPVLSGPRGISAHITFVEREVRPDADASARPAVPDPPGGPRERRLMLGTRLRSLREARGISTEKAGYEIRASHSKISRMELGRVNFKERDVSDLLTLYGISDPGERAPLLQLAREAKIRNWWQKYGDVLPGWFEVYLGMEEAASLLRTYEVQHVPELLQTDDYARAVVRRGHPGASDEEIERRLRVHRIRQRRITWVGASSPRLWVVLDEAVFRRRIGAPAVMRRQIERLIEVSGQPEFRVQVLPFGAGLYPTGGSFTIMRFADQSLPDVAYLEQLTGATYLDRPADVERYKLAMDSISNAATRPDHTVRLLTRILRDL